MGLHLNAKIRKVWKLQAYKGDKAWWTMPSIYTQVHLYLQLQHNGALQPQIVSPSLLCFYQPEPSMLGITDITVFFSPTVPFVVIQNEPMVFGTSLLRLVSSV